MIYNKEEHDEIIKKSHERSEQYGVEKGRMFPTKILKGEEASNNIRQNEELIRTSGTFIKSLYDFLRDSGFVIVLTDRDGCILSIIGDDEILKAAKKMNMVIGAYMDEKNIGTNAMGTAIKEDVPIQISAKEHFITAYHKWTCSAAPVHDFEGNIIGTLNLTGNSDLVHPHTLGLVVAAVRSIENQIKIDRTSKYLNEAYSYMKAIMNSFSYGIFAVDLLGNIKSVNETACAMISIQKENTIDRSMNEIINSWNDISNLVLSNKIYRDEEVNISINNKGRFLLSVYDIKDDDEKIIGMVVTIKEMQSIYNLVNKYTGMRARYTFNNLIGNSDEIRRVIEYGKAVAFSPSTILITGESGTGKEVLAQSIHNFGDRKDAGFVAINCGAIPKNLIESELFGYDDGAFTGAKKGGHPGKFELANGGTLFLDEIGEMPIDMQVSLLRVIQEGCITRIGGNKYIPINVRIIAATNKDLKNEIEKGNFRKDLFYRLSVIPIVIPPLRERKDDIELYIKYFLQIKSLKLNKSVIDLNSTIYKQMMDYDWPGNIRELENYIEHIVNLDGKPTIDILNPKHRENSIDFYKEKKENNLEKDIFNLSIVEKNTITKCVFESNGNISRAADCLGISRNTLYSKIKQYKINIK